jgi:hypothetical protein
LNTAFDYILLHLLDLDIGLIASVTSHQGNDYSSTPFDPTSGMSLPSCISSAFMRLIKEAILSLENRGFIFDF